VDEFSNSVMVVKLEFEKPLKEISKIEKQDRNIELTK
jgi:hypothetical protein